MNIRTKIEKTEAFKKLPQYKKNIYQKVNNIRKLHEQYIMAQQQGYDVWKQEYRPSDAEDKIIKELLTPKV